MAVAPNQQRDATITTEGRSTWRTISPMNPQVVAMAASAVAAVLELDRCRTPASLRGGPDDDPGAVGPPARAGGP
jgi:hypothetical protein